MSEFPEPGPSSTGKIGTGMTVAACVIALMLASWYFDDFFNREYNPNQDIATRELDGIKEITLKRNRRGHYVTSGKINNTDVRFMLDTGATHVSIPGDVARQLKLEAGNRQIVNTANGRVYVYATMLDKIQIGDIVLANVRASINPHMRDEDILLGMSFLKHLEFSQRGDELVLRQYD